MDTKTTGGCMCGSVRYETTGEPFAINHCHCCLLYTSDAADDSLRVDLGGRRIIKKIFF